MRECKANGDQGWSDFESKKTARVGYARSGFATALAERLCLSDRLEDLLRLCRRGEASRIV